MDIETCLHNSPYLEGYIFENAGTVQGYAMVAKSFSTEFGKGCIWIDEAVRRPGRFDYVIEISKPSLEGCKSIFRIHTAKLRYNLV